MLNVIESKENEEVYEVKISYRNIIKEETIHLSKKQLDWYFRNTTYCIKVGELLGHQNKSYISSWLKIGRNNIWIKEAYNPPFTKDIFYECMTVDHLLDKLAKGNWSLGKAFYYKNLCFINQQDGGDEWLIIRDDIPFESINCGKIISKNRTKMKLLIKKYLSASDSQLKNWTNRYF